MFAPDSRYAAQPISVVTLADGTQVSVVQPPRPLAAPVIGYHQSIGSGRLDLVATEYLGTPTGFWRLCDANNAMLAGALAARALIGIPEGAAS